MIADVKTYARARMTALGYTEWSGGFNDEIPQTILNTRYFLKLGQGVDRSVNQDHEEIICPLTIEAFLKPDGNPKTLIDRGAAKADAICAEFLLASNRCTQSGIKNVTFSGSNVSKIADSDDNGVKIEVNFNVLVIVPTI